MPNSQNDSILAVKKIQHDIAAVPKVNWPLTALGIHFFGRSANTGLLGDDSHAFADDLYRTLGGIYIAFGKKSVEALQVQQRRW